MPDLEQTQEQRSRYELLRKWPGRGRCEWPETKEEPSPGGKRRGGK